MKKKILISINPHHAQNIVDGIKKYEFRTKVAKKEISSFLIYATSPVKKVIAEVEVVEVLRMPPSQLWLLACDESATTKKCFDLYFNNRQCAYAYKLGNINVFDKPKELSDFGIRFAPQSFVYIEPEYHVW